MTHAADLLSDAKFEVRLANRAINRALNINSRVTRWLEVAHSHRQRAAAWRTLQTLVEDQAIQQALSLAAAHDSATAQRAMDEARKAGCPR